MVLIDQLCSLFLAQKRGPLSLFFFFFFNDTATTEIYTLSLHDALPISRQRRSGGISDRRPTLPTAKAVLKRRAVCSQCCLRSEEHTSELQSRQYLVCRLLLEKKKKVKHRGPVHRRTSCRTGRQHGPR